MGADPPHAPETPREALEASQAVAERAAPATNPAPTHDDDALGEASRDAEASTEPGADASSTAADGAVPPETLAQPAPPESGERELSSSAAPAPKRGAARRAELDTQQIALRSSGFMPPEEDLEPIAPFGRFEILGRLATGGMAEILLARETSQGAGSRHVVLKAIRGELPQEGAFAGMFLNEGRLAMRLTHPNICTVYECGRHEGRFFMAMEYVHGQTLRDILLRCAQRDESLPIPVLLRVFSLVAEALEFAHSATDAQGRPLSIVHRDVTPHNIMIRYDGVVKLLDFGVAKAERSQHSTESGALKGKFSYMAPEQAMDTGVDARADIFSLGVCLFEAVTGRRLFHRKAQYDTLKALLESDPPPLCAFRDDVPDRLEEIVQRALAKDPDARYASAGALQHDLDELLSELREVASTSRIRSVMQGLFAEEAARWPALERDEQLRERYTPPPLVERREVDPTPARQLPPLFIAVALAVLAAAAVGGGWYALAARSAEAEPDPSVASSASEPQAPSRATGEEPTPTALPSDSPLERVAPPSAALPEPPSEPAPEPVAAASVVEPTTRTPDEGPTVSNPPASTATDVRVARTRLPAPPRPAPRGTVRHSPEGPSRPSTSSSPATTRTRRGPVIVTDPGF